MLAAAGHVYLPLRAGLAVAASEPEAKMPLLGRVIGECAWTLQNDATFQPNASAKANPG